MSSSPNSDGLDVTVSGVHGPLPSLSGNDRTPTHQHAPPPPSADPETVIYIGLPTLHISENCKAQVAKLAAAVKLTHSWLNTHVAIEVDKRTVEGVLPRDYSVGARWARSSYRTKVADFLLTNRCSW